MCRKVCEVLTRWEQMNRVYDEDYVLRYFRIYEDELPAIIRALKKRQKVKGER